MSVRRIVRFIIGVIVAGALLFLLLPLAGIPTSHLQPPGIVYGKAQGETRGSVIGKHFEQTGNPFHIGDELYFVDYQFRAHTPPMRGSNVPGPVQTYRGTVHVDSPTYEQFSIPATEKDISFPAKQMIPLTPSPVHIKYEKTYPDINGIEEGWGGRNIGAGSNILSGWLIWVVVAIVLGYILAALFERFGRQEDI